MNSNNPAKKLTITTLSTAVRNNQEELVKNSLNQYGLPKNGTKTTDYTLLQTALTRNHFGIAKLLINAGCRINKNSNDTGYTPLQYAISKKNTELATLLLAKGAELDAEDGAIAFNLAAEKKSLKILKSLLQKGIDVNFVRNGKTALQVFLEQFMNSGMHITATLKMILNAGASTNFQFNCVQAPTNFQFNCVQAPTVILYTYIKNLAANSTIPTEDDVNLINKMLAERADPAFRYDNSRCSTLYLALKLQHEEIILSMLHRIFDRQSTDLYLFNEKSILHLFFCYEVEWTENQELFAVKMAKICITRGAMVDAKDDDSKTPLYWAVLMRKKYMVQMLLERGADPNLCDNKGGTILENLMKNEVAMIGFEMIRRSFNGPLELTQKKIPKSIEKDSEIAKMLFIRKAMDKMETNDEVAIFHYWAQNSCLDLLYNVIPYCNDINWSDYCGNTLLHRLLDHNLNIMNSKTEVKVAAIVKMLLAKGADSRALNGKNETPLHLAAKGKHRRALGLLLFNDNNVQDLDIDGNSCLHFLCMLHFKVDDSVEKDLTDFFISKGCDVNAKNNNGMTPLLFAAQSGSVNILKILMSYGANTNCAENENLSQPIHLASLHGHCEFIEKLLCYGVDINAKQINGKTALHLSTDKNVDCSVTILLLNNGADANLKDNYGRTPLHLACMDNNDDKVRVLLNYGADLNVENMIEYTPLLMLVPNSYRESSDTWLRLYLHTILLRTANVPLSRRNLSCIDEFLKIYKNYENQHELDVTRRLAIEEISQMQDVRITTETTLADVLKMSDNKLSIVQFNEDFKKLINSEEFDEKYPIYANLIRACYRKGVVRNKLMLPAKDALTTILGFVLPDICCDAVFDYLDNENLHSIIDASKIRIQKRKRFDDEVDENTVAKRVKRK